MSDSKVHGANMGPTWVLSAPDGPHVGPMNLAIWDFMASTSAQCTSLLCTMNLLLHCNYVPLSMCTNLVGKIGAKLTLLTLFNDTSLNHNVLATSALRAIMCEWNIGKNSVKICWFKPCHPPFVSTIDFPLLFLAGYDNCHYSDVTMGSMASQMSTSTVSNRLFRRT